MRTESLQGRPPRWLETFIATWTVAGDAKKSSHAAVCDDPRVPLSRLRVPVQSFATVLDGECFVAVVSSGRSPNGAIAVGFSIATTASPCADIPHCSTAPSHASAEISFCILSANTPGFAVVALAVGPVVLCREVAFSVELTDLDCWGSWEGSLPESSSLGGDRTPLRGAFISLQTGIQELTAGNNFINFVGLPTPSPPSSRGGLAHSGPPKWPFLSPPPTARTQFHQTPEGRPQWHIQVREAAGLFRR